MKVISLEPSGDRTASLLVVNSNSSAAVSRQIAAAVEAAKPHGVAVDVATVAAGPEGIDSALDVLIGGYETVKLIAAVRDRYDAFVIGCGNDPGLVAARQLTDRPVVGIAEAGMFEACHLGATFAVPVFSAAKVTMMRQLVAFYGLTDRLAAVVPMQTSTVEASGDAGALAEQLCLAALTARDESFAEVIVLTGSVMAAHVTAVSERVGLPVVAGLQAAVRAAGGLGVARARTSHRFTYRTASQRDRLHGHVELGEAFQRGGSH